MKCTTARMLRDALDAVFVSKKFVFPRSADLAVAMRIEALEDRQLLSALTSTVSSQTTVVKPTHIVVVVEEDRAANAIGNVTQAPYSDMPYFNQLASTGLVYNNSHGLNTTAQQGEMNYLALYSGSTQGVTDDSNHGIFTTPTLAGSLNSAGLTFSGYAESLPHAGDMTDNYAASPTNAAYDDLYVRAYNPMAQFSNVGTNISNAQVNQTFASFPTTATGFNALPTVSFVIPNTLHNTHGSNDTDPYATDPSQYDFLRTNADTWLKQNLDAYVQWAKQNNSLLIVTDDEGDRANNFNAGFATIIAGSTNLFVPGVDATNVTPYNILRTIEDMYGLTKLGSTTTAADLDTTAQGLLGAPQSASVTTLISSAPSSVAGQSVTFTAKVAPIAPATGTPTGNVKFMDGTTLLGTSTLNGSSTATFTTTTLSVASHSITAVYGADANFNASTSAVLTQSVAKDTTTTVLKSSANPSVTGQSVTFTATVAAVAPGSGTPTGSVNFMDGTTLLGNATLGSGVATFTTPSLTVASHSITAVYGADVNFTASTSAAVTQSITRDSTTTTVTSSANPSVSGQSVTFTATVLAAAPGAGKPTGSVNFLDGTTVLGSATLSASGTAMFSSSSLAITSHAITAVYLGDTNFTSGTSAALNQTVGHAATATSLTSSVNPSVAGQTVTFTATVSVFAPGTGTPTGSVSFMDGSTFLGSATLNGAGVATFGAPLLLAASHSITAVYGGNANFNSSTSAALSQSVNRDATKTTLASSANPSVLSQSVTFTATVSAAAPGSGIPTGTVNFMDGLALLGSATLNGSGIATFTTSALSIDSHSITAAYVDDLNYTASTSAALSQSVAQDSTSVAITSSANPSVNGQSVTFTATVSSVAPATGIPTGFVDFINGKATVATVAVDASGTATYTTTLLAGSDNISATYDGDASFAASTSATLVQQVNPAATAIALASSPNPSIVGQSVVFTATISVSAPGSGKPTGAVAFIDGTTVLGSAPLNGYGVAMFSSSTLSLASHSITATYAGDDSFAASTSTAITQSVTRDSTLTVVTSSANPSAAAQNVTFTATVSAVAPGSGIPTGSVNFLDGTTLLGTSPLDGAGTATYTTSTLTRASHSITAVYLSDANYSTSTSAPLNQSISAYISTTTLTSSANPSELGQSVTFTATVAALAVTTLAPTGQVKFMDGTTLLGTASLNGAGHATWTISTLSMASHSITASYAGDSNFNASASSALTQSVGQDSSAVALMSSANPSVTGQGVTFTADVTAVAPATGTPTGQVDFLDGSILLGAATLDGSGNATFTSLGLSVSTHKITAVYLDDAIFAGSTSAILTQVVNRDATVTALTSSVNPSVIGQGTTFTATVTAAAPGSGSPTGSVTFMDGATALETISLNGTGQASFADSTLLVAPHTITAVYNADANFAASTSAPLIQVVNGGASTTALTSSADTSVFGQSVTITATVTPVAAGTGTPAGSVTFMDDAAILATVPLDGSGSAAFVSSAYAVGSNTITAVYTGNFIGSTSAAFIQTVNRDSTTTSLTSSANPAVFGQGVTFTATVSAAAPGSGTPTGNVQFMDGSTILATVALDNTGSATSPSFMPTTGSHAITAVYLDDANFSAGASAALTQVVNRAATTTSLTSSANPTAAGANVTFTATVDPVAPGSGTPTGNIVFMDGATVLGSVPLFFVNSTTFTTTMTSYGSHSITALYVDDANFAPSTSAPLIQVVNQEPSITTVTSSANPVAAGKSVTYTAIVAATIPGSPTPTGNITFMDGSTTLATVALNTSAAATFTSTPSIGSHTITAVYGSDPSFAASTSAALTQVVNRYNTTTSVKSSATATVAGQSVTFTATVAGVLAGSLVPTGTVNFLDGATIIGSAALNSSDKATFTTTALIVASHTITAVYADDANFAPSTSAAITQKVTRASTKTVVTTSGASAIAGQAVTFTATVTAVSPGSGIPTGNVKFMDGTTLLGTVALNAAGQAIFTTTALSVASHSIKAAYADDLNYAPSTSTAITETVKKASTTTSLSSSANPSTSGQSVTFTATVSPVAPSVGIPTGSVKFMSGSTLLATVALNAGTATYTTSTLSVGSHNITAVYVTDANYAASTSAALVQIVNIQTASNDNFANATIISGTSITLTGTNVGATKQAGEPNHAGNSGGASVWYTWTASKSGTVTINTDGSDFDTLLAVYTGNSVSTLTAVPGGSDDDEFNNGQVRVTSSVTFAVTAGTVYHIAVDGYGGVMGSIVLNLSLM